MFSLSLLRKSSFSLLAWLLPGWLALVFYLPTLTHGYVWDDTYLLRDLPYLRDPELWWHALREPLFVSHNYFRPLPLLMFMFESRFDGGASVFHAVNVLLHVLNTTLLVALARALLRGRHTPGLAALAGMLFALHPALVENVSWISDRFDLLMTTFVFLALWIVHRVAAGAPRNLLLGVCLLGALASKETGIVLAVLLPLWQVVLMRRDGFARLQVIVALRAQPGLYLALLAAVGVYLSLRYAAFGFLYRTDVQMQAGDTLSHLLLIGKTLGWYATLLLFPFGRMAPVHPGVTPIAYGDVGAWCGLVLVVVLCCGLWRYLRRGQTTAWLGLMIAVAFAPLSNLLPLTIGDNIVHDRYLILPVAFAVLMLVHAAQGWPQRAVPAACAWLLICAVNVVMIVPHWQSEQTLWQWAYQRYPESQIAGANYLAVLVNEHRNEEALALCERMAHWNVEGYRSGALEMRAFILLRMGRLQAAEAAITQALVSPDRGDEGMGRLIMSERLNLLARIQMGLQHWDAAGGTLRESLRLSPYYPKSHYWLAVWQYRTGHISDGDASLEAVRRYALPDYAEAFVQEAQAIRDQAISPLKRPS